MKTLNMLGCVTWLALSISLVLSSEHTLVREKLLEFYTLTGGDSWLQRNGWGSEVSYCEWFGTTCLQGSLVELDLSANNLTGSLLYTLNTTNLSSLTSVKVRNNRLSGVLPLNFLSNSLQRLDIRDNDFSQFPLLPQLSTSRVHQNLVVTMRGNKIWCPLPNYVEDVLTKFIFDWNATSCETLRSKTKSYLVSVTVMIELPTPSSSVVEKFNKTIGGLLFTSADPDAGTELFQFSMTSILYEILSRPQINAPQQIPKAGAIPFENDLFMLENVTIYGMPRLWLSFTSNVSDSKRINIANRILTDHDSITILQLGNIVLVDQEGSQLVETPAPTTEVYEGSIDNNDTKTHIVVAAVLIGVIVVVVVLFVCVKSKAFVASGQQMPPPGPINVASGPPQQGGPLPPAQPQPQPLPPAPGQVNY